jgi:signal transduction protein with GAF and PtsI domain
MSNDNAQLTPRGELVADVLTALLLIGMGYAIVRAVAVVVVRLGQFLGLV